MSSSAQTAISIPGVSNKLLLQPVLGPGPCKAGVSPKTPVPPGRLKVPDATGLAELSSPWSVLAGVNAAGWLEAPEICKLSRSRQSGVIAAG